MSGQTSDQGAPDGADSRPLAVPRLPPGFVRRERLISLLNDFGQSPITVVRGPAGSGKTTLIADWISTQVGDTQAEGAQDVNAQDISTQADEINLLWLNCHAAMDTPEAFWTSAADRIQASGLATRPANFRAMASALQRHGGVPIIVFDDFHTVTPQIAAEVTRFTTLLNRGRVILLTRELNECGDPLRAIQIHEESITAQDIAFTTAELRDLASTLDQAVDADEILALTHGHCLLTRFVLSIPESASPEQASALAGNWVEGVISTDLLPQAMLLALLPAFDQDMATRITADEASFTRLLQDGLGAQDQLGFFVFHRVVHDTLKARAARELSNQEQQRVRRVGAMGLKSHPDYGVAVFDLLIQTQQFDEAWRFSATNFPEQIPSESIRTIEAVPSSLFTKNWSLAALASVLQSMRVPTTSPSLRRTVDVLMSHARQQPPAQDPEDAIFREIAVLALLWSVRRYEEGTEQTARLIELSERLNPHSQSGVWDALSWAVLHGATMATLSFDFGTANRFLDVLIGDEDPRRSRRRDLQRAFNAAMSGDISAAERILESPECQGREVPGTGNWRVRALITRGAIQLERGDAARARETLRSAEPLLRNSGEWPYVLIVISRTHLATGTAEGIEDVDRIYREHSHRRVSRGLRDGMNSALADLALAGGHLHRARELVADREESDIAMRLSAARIALVSPSADTVTDLEQLTMMDTVGPRLRSQAFLLISVHLHRLGQRKRSHQALRKALMLTNTLGIRLITALVPRSDLVKIAQGAGVDLPDNVNEANPVEAQLQSLDLTNREMALLQHLATPALLRDIAAAEFVSLSTIKTQAASIYRKFEVSSRAAAVEAARMRGLIDPAPPATA